MQLKYFTFGSKRIYKTLFYFVPEFILASEATDVASFEDDLKASSATERCLISENRLLQLKGHLESYLEN